jgi:nucleoside-diphosphate-sugar epimerase
MKIAVFGAAGRTGRHVVEQALAAGHEVVALVRASDRDWTIVRVPRLMDGPRTEKITVAYVG